MAGHDVRGQDMPVIRNRADFDASSGNLLERMVFNYRPLVVLVCALVTVWFAVQALGLAMTASFDKVIPRNHPYIQNYLTHQQELPALGNTLRIVVENRKGTIYDADYLRDLATINDTLFLTPGVDRTWMKSLYTPIVRWREVTEVGLDGGAVMPADFNGSPESMDTLRANIARAGLVGSLISNDLKSSMIVVPLIERDPNTGEQLDYHAFSRQLEEKIRSLESEDTGVYIVGFAKLVGDLIDGVLAVMNYFAVATAIAAVLIYLYSRCVRSTIVVLVCSIVAVIWQLGIIHALGYALDPYSVLVPFLVFAIGVSHGAQKMNGIMRDIGQGTHKYVAARYTFRRLFLAGFTALLADVVGFAVLIIIDIPVIQDLAITASIGVGVLIFTNLLLLPVLLSFSGVDRRASDHALKIEANPDRGMFAAMGRMLDPFTTRTWALPTIVLSAMLFAGGLFVAQDLKIGDLDNGAPELRPESRYNQDNAFITANYNLSNDQFAVIIKTPPDRCGDYQSLQDMDRLEAELRQLPGVLRVESLASTTRQFTASVFEGAPKWQTISRDQSITNSVVGSALIADSSVANRACSIVPLIVYLTDHKADTLSVVLERVESFAATYNREEIQFLPAAGSAGIEAVTNVVVGEASRLMLLYVYAAVIALCFITFRSWRAVVVAVVPLIITSILCEALMVWLGMGMKVATLPVVALGVGIGVDYAIYLLSVQLALQRSGLNLRDAYRQAVRFTGKVVALIGVTLAAGVITWAWSPIKFQADMGILLTFMFLWNMIGALVMIPALSVVLLRRKDEGEEFAPTKVGVTPA